MDKFPESPPALRNLLDRGRTLSIVERLQRAAYLSDEYGSAPANSDRESEAWDELMMLKPAVDAILRRYVPDILARATPDDLKWYRDCCLQAVGVVTNEAFIQSLAPAGPSLQATEWHPWIWTAAESLWRSGHYRAAVAAAAGNLTAQTQAKVQRWDVADDDLMTQALTPKDPEPGKGRLRVQGDWDSQFVRGLQEGLMSYARGAYALIRNPATHDVAEWLEQDALEQLSALSVLARQIDQTRLLTH